MNASRPASIRLPAAVAAVHASPFTGEVKPVLYVRDVEASAPFFRDVLGFEFLGYTDADGSPYYAEMAAGALKFGLHDPLNEEHGGWVGHQIVFAETDPERHTVDPW